MICTKVVPVSKGHLGGAALKYFGMILWSGRLAESWYPPNNSLLTWGMEANQDCTIIWYKKSMLGFEMTALKFKS